jgi:hypothetical protein
MSGNSLLSRILGTDADEGQSSNNSTKAFDTVRSRKRSKPELEEQPRDGGVNLALETIDDLPSDFPRDSAVRIVRRTLAAAGIEIGEFNKFTWERTPHIRAEMELARSREKEFQKKTEEDIRALEAEIRKARETYETIRAKEEGEISRASKELENIKRVRDFFGFSDMEGDNSVSVRGEATEERGPLYAAGGRERPTSFSSRSFSGSSRLEAKKNGGPRGEEVPVRDSLDAAWGQIEALRAQARQRLNSGAGANGPAREPAEGSSVRNERHNSEDSR